MPARIRRIRSRRVWKPRRWRRILPGPYDDAVLSLPHLLRGDEQAADPAVSRRRAHRACASRWKSYSTRLRARPDWSRTRCGCEPGAAASDAVREHHRQVLRQRRLSRSRCAAQSPRSMSRACARVRTGGEATAARIGIRLCIYCEQAAHGTSVYAGWGIPMVPGFEQAVARMTPDGGLELRVGIQTHGQGLETTLAQVAHEVLGIDIANNQAWCTAIPR